MTTYKTNGTLTTTIKSFSESQQPNRLDGLTYSLNGQSITVDVIASPGTASEEVNSVTLDGANGYDLSWSSQHSDFQLEITLSTSDTSQTPSFDAVSVSAYPPNAPSVSLSYVADDQLDTTIDADTSGAVINGYEVEMLRDDGSWVSPAGGPNSFNHDGSTSYTKSYGPASDAAYGKQVGIDSSFQFRARAVNSAGASDWATSGTVYTTPVPPHNPSVSRPDGETIEISATQKSDIGDYITVGIAEDTGDGYGGFNYFDAVEPDEPQFSGGFSKGDSFTITYNVGETYQAGWALKQDARYQIEIWTNRYSSSRVSKRVYADYGNDGDVYFEDDFEDGDAAEWDSFDAGNGSQSSATVVQSPNSSDLNISGADSGSYFLEVDYAEKLTKQLGDLSTESDVLVKCVMASGSLDSDSESNLIEWYDGSSWQVLHEQYWEYNQQGWVEVSIPVPDSYLSTDNRLRIGQFSVGYGADAGAFDRVVVSDILHEYTTPAAASDPELDNTTRREITAGWTDNASHESAHELKLDVSGTPVSEVDTYTVPSGNESHTVTGLLDGTQYAASVQAVRSQPRRGVESQVFRSAGSSIVLATTRLPNDNEVAVSDITPTSADLSWSNPENNATEKRVYLRQTNGRTGMDFEPNDDDYVHAECSGRFDSVTWLARFRVDDWANANNHGILHNTYINGDQTDDKNIGLWVSSDDGYVWGRVGDSSGQYSFSEDGASVSLGEVATGAVVYDADEGEARLFVNGALDHSIAASGTQVADERGAHFGSQGGETVNGAVFEVARYNRPLSQSEIQSFHDGDPPANGLVGYWPLDLNHSGTTPDLSTYSNYGIVNGPTLTGPTVEDVSGSLAADASSYSLADLLNGEEYDAYVHTRTDHNEVRSRR